jgi:hypothetical protein
LISLILTARIRIGTALMDEITCTDTFGVTLKAGNLNPACRLRFELAAASCADAQ